DRELAADRAAIDVASPEAFASALVRFAAFAPLWPLWRLENVAWLNKGLAIGNLSVAFADFIRHSVDETKLVAHMNEMLQTRIALPTDSHPPVAERLAAIGQQVPHYEAGILPTAEDTAASGLGDLDAIEIELTLQLQKHVASLRPG